MTQNFILISYKIPLRNWEKPTGGGVEKMSLNVSLWEVKYFSFLFRKG